MLVIILKTTAQLNSYQSNIIFDLNLEPFISIFGKNEDQWVHFYTNIIKCQKFISYIYWKIIFHNKKGAFPDLQETFKV